MEFYLNGEKKTKSDINQEHWFNNYQSLLEIATRESWKDAHELLELYLIDYQITFNKDCENINRIRKWCQ